MNSRYTQLCQWLTQATNILQPELKMVAGDASFRRYYRLLWRDTSYIVMDAPPPEEDCTPFVRISRHWFQQGVHVPEVIAQDLDQGFLLLQDFGDNQLLSALLSPSTTGHNDLANAGRLYRKAQKSLIKIQRTTGTGLELPPYNRELLLREMALFRDWFCCQWLELELNDQDISLLDRTFECLSHSALQQPQVPVHRDYHSRNLMLTEDDDIGIIDFQDAVQGPITYDLVSLLKDCYIHWPPEAVSHWCDDYQAEARLAGVLPENYPREKFHQEFDLMGAQRHLKAIGIFARLWLRDGKANYLDDIPRTLQHLLEATEKYQNLSPFHQWLLDRVVPALNKKQSAKESI